MNNNVFKTASILCWISILLAMRAWEPIVMMSSWDVQLLCVFYGMFVIEGWSLILIIFCLLYISRGLRHILQVARWARVSIKALSSWRRQRSHQASVTSQIPQCSILVTSSGSSCFKIVHLRVLALGDCSFLKGLVLYAHHLTAFLVDTCQEVT